MIEFNPRVLYLDRCTHCGVSRPNLVAVWSDPISSTNGFYNEVTISSGRKIPPWVAYRCQTCGGIISVSSHCSIGNQYVNNIYPKMWSADDAIEERAATYLAQAKETLNSPDASVVMSASAIDAMLVDHELKVGSLFKRIDQAAEDGIITNSMAEWAHSVRLDSNKPRHVDKDKPHMTTEDAQRAFNFAQSLAEILYVLPSRMPAEEVKSDANEDETQDP